MKRRMREQKAGHSVHPDDLHSSIKDEEAERRRRRMRWMLAGGRGGKDKHLLLRKKEG